MAVPCRTVSIVAEMLLHVLTRTGVRRRPRTT